MLRQKAFYCIEALRVTGGLFRASLAEIAKIALQRFVREVLGRQARGSRCNDAAHVLQLIKTTSAFLCNNVEYVDRMREIGISALHGLIDAFSDRLAVGRTRHLLQLSHGFQAMIALSQDVGSP